MTAKKSAFLFPLHEPKFLFGNDLILSCNTYLPDYSIFVVFSSVEESESFKNLYSNLIFGSIIYPYGVDSGIINKKKYFGVQHLIDNTDFECIACIDSEALFIKKVDVDKRFEKVYKRKKIFASKTSPSETIPGEVIDKIIRTPVRFFSEKEAERLGVILDSFKLYFWFNDIPVYKRDVFERFSKHISLKEKFATLIYQDFDYILYSYYCLLHEGFEIRVITNKRYTFSFMESQKYMNKTLFLKGLYKIQPNWIYRKTFLYKRAFMTFHNDIYIGRQKKNIIIDISKRVVNKIIRELKAVNILKHD